MSAKKVGWLLVCFLISNAGAQSRPAATGPRAAAVFGEFSINTPHFNPDRASYGLLYGGVAGAYLQRKPWLGIEARVLFLQSTSQPDHEEHQRAVYLGPRFEATHHRLGIDGAFLGGVSHSDFPASPMSKYPNGSDVLTTSTAPAIEAGGGFSLRLNRGVSWRVGEVTYDCAFGNQQPRGAVFSTGLMVRLFPHLPSGEPAI